MNALFHITFLYIFNINYLYCARRRTFQKIKKISLKNWDRETDKKSIGGKSKSSFSEKSGNNIGLNLKIEMSAF